MSPDRYLDSLALFLNYFLRVAVAFVLFWLLSRLLRNPRQKFLLWLSFLACSLGYWVFALTAFGPWTTIAPQRFGVTHPASPVGHQLLLPASFEHNVTVTGEILASIYIAGVLLLISREIWKRLRLRFFLRQGRAASGELQQLFSEMCRHFGIRHCELMVLNKLTSPATVYWWRPRVIVPEICERLGDKILVADIFYHELAHVARRDYLWSSISDLTCALLFFHPAVWQARKKMRMQREMACDLAVVAVRPEHRADYADTLTRVARLCLPEKYSIAGVDFAPAPSLLKQRIQAILNEPGKCSHIGKMSRVFAGGTMIAGYGFLCSALAVAVAFAPSSQQRETVAKPLATTHSQHRMRRPHLQPAGEHFITESPAYRLTAVPDSSNYGSENLRGTQEPANLESRSIAGATGKRPVAGPVSGPGDTLHSIIVATVGTIAGVDKDDRNKKK